VPSEAKYKRPRSRTKCCHDGIVQQAEKRGFHCEIGVDGPIQIIRFGGKVIKPPGGTDFFSLDGQSPTRVASFFC
jgi:hypothetical protein